eukprot:maker-scaffold233_size243130-snap-gene-0.13 protein:Tk00487 transcript:maker-scaffold233_size243130-snap-gene-0.13-mRNA-1 annotation:"hypothetical protein DAPPUDRAFT_258391"
MTTKDDLGVSQLVMRSNDEHGYMSRAIAELTLNAEEMLELDFAHPSSVLALSEDIAAARIHYTSARGLLSEASSQRFNWFKSKQGPTQDALEYLVQIKEVGFEADIGKLTGEENLIFRFLSSIHDIDLKEKLFALQNPTLADIANATSIHIATFDCARMGDDPHGSVRAVRERMPVDSPKTRAMGSPPPTSTCALCGHAFHYGDTCPALHKVFKFKLSGSLPLETFSNLELPDADLVFIVDLTNDKYKDLLVITLRAQGRNRENQLFEQSEKQPNERQFLNAYHARQVTQHWGRHYEMITAKIPRTGVATQFQLNPQDIKIVAKLVDKLSKDSDFSGTITANLKAFGLPLWKAFSFPVNVDFSTLIQVPWSSLPPACLEWTNRTPDNFWPEKKVILKMKKAGVALTPMCSPKDGKLSLDFGTAFSHEELLKTIPKFKVILIFLKDFLFKHKKIIKSNLLVQAMFWVMESHACGKPLENIFKNQDLKIAQPTKPNPCLGMGEFAIECLAFLKLALVEKKLPSYFLPRAAPKRSRGLR